ncbi:MAG TPA: alginate lyase family protein, partial [Thermoleophilia bacterium]|nr:alginate lyase family protein [Thermoleophilia bacterium]
SLILTTSDIDAIRARLEARLEPESSAWRVFLSARVKPALSGDPGVVAGPLTSGGVGSTLELALDKDGGAARNLALAYAFTGDTSYAAKARAYLLAWAAGNTPTTCEDCGDKWAGSYQAHGAFMFAYAYDLIYDSGVLSRADMTIVESWFRRFVDALDTYNVQLKNEWVITHPSYTLPYAWDASRSYNVYDDYVGGDRALLQQTARLAMARVIGYTSVVGDILDCSTDVLCLDSMSKSSLTPRNDGDGVSGHASPTPQVNVYKKPISGRGGTVDYMTYNTRLDAVMFEIAENSGWNAGKSATLRTRLRNAWDYLARYFGPDAEPAFAPNDTPSASACLPRFALAYREFGDSSYLAVLNSGDRSTYYEPQLLGPVTLTHSIVR